MDGFFELSGCELIALANLVSVSLAQNLTADQIGILASFATAVGDNLAILAVTKLSPNNDGEC